MARNPYQELLGHKSSKTTEIYAHVSQRDIGRVKSPLDFGSLKVKQNSIVKARLFSIVVKQKK
jgi:hypothetical protein